jgi:phosphoglycerate dehydrogenase-like enzyme
VRALVPYEDWSVDPDLPAGLDVDVYDGGQPTVPVDDVEFYVLPYMAGPEPGRLIARLPALKVVQTLTAGVDDVRPLVPDGVTLCNARGVHDASTAELALALLLASQRGIPDFVRDAGDGRWAGGRRESLADRTVLVVGHGSVGQAVEARLTPFECTVRRVARLARDGVSGFGELPDLLPEADVVVLTVPYTAETRGMVDAAFLGAMKDGALLVNVARGPVVDTAALVAETSSGRLRAALDVTDPEPLPRDHALLKLDNVIITPHLGSATEETRRKMAEMSVANLFAALEGKPLLFEVRAG